MSSRLPPHVAYAPHSPCGVWRHMSTAPLDGTQIIVKTKDGGRHIVAWQHVDVEATPMDWCVAPDLGYIEGGWHYTCKPTGWHPLPPI